VNTTNTSQAVAGVGTSWVAINRGRGDVISICDQAFPTCTTSTNYVVLGVGSDTQLTLTTAYTGSTGSHGYTIRRQFRGLGNAGQALVDWEDCIDGGPCAYFGAGITMSLVFDNRREVGIAYEDSVFGLAADFSVLGSTTDATRTITLTADGINRHNGAAGAGVVVDAQLGPNEVIVRDANVTIEWLEVRGLRAADNQGLVRVLNSGATNVLLQNLLIHDFYEPAVGLNQGGLRLSGTAGKSVTVRNVMIWDGDHRGIEADELGDTLTIENCSIDDMRDAAGSPRSGVYTGATTGVIVRNTIATRSGTDFATGSGSFAAGATSTNNISSDATAPGSNPLSALAANLYVNPGVDLHLKSGAVAIDSGVSLAASFVNDIDGQPRQAGAWDRGADELAATALYRSVGITGTALASGAGNALTIAGSTATFASGLPNIIGVGDAIQYDSDNNGSIDALAFIHGRTSAQAYTVKDKSGAAPLATATPDTDWAVYRAYTSLFNWAAQNENGNISNAPVALRDFDTSSDLVSANTTMNVACYGDGADTQSIVNVGSAWITGPSNYIRIYTPYLPVEVGTSQRHSGTWNATTAYRFERAVPPNSSLLRLGTNYVRVDGLQLWFTSDVANSETILVAGATGVSSYEVSNNIVRGIGGAATQAGRFGIDVFSAGGAGSVAKIWNNLVYDTGPIAGAAGILSEDADFTVYAYNNTLQPRGAIRTPDRAV
jgi:hypothetical protein